MYFRLPSTTSMNWSIVTSSLTITSQLCSRYSLSTDCTTSWESSDWRMTQQKEKNTGTGNGRRPKAHEKVKKVVASDKKAVHGGVEGGRLLLLFVPCTRARADGRLWISSLPRVKNSPSFFTLALISPWAGLGNRRGHFRGQTSYETLNIYLILLPTSIYLGNRAVLVLLDKFTATFETKTTTTTTTTPQNNNHGPPPPPPTTSTISATTTANISMQCTTCRREKGQIR